jgi:hypothetical protein
MIRKRDKVFSIGLMAGNMMERGSMESNMEPERILLQAVNLGKENGKLERDLIGAPINETIKSKIFSIS